MIRHRVDQEDPAYAVSWREGVHKTLIDFVAGHTFELKVKHTITGELVLTKVTGIVATSPPVEDEPNVVATWAIDETLTIPPGVYELHLKARTAGGRDRPFRPGNPELIEFYAVP
jgi:hypothetical protein